MRQVDSVATTMEVDVTFQMSGLLDVEPDDDAGDDGRENAVDEDDLDADLEDDLSDEDELLDIEEATDIRDKLSE